MLCKCIPRTITLFHRESTCNLSRDWLPFLPWIPSNGLAPLRISNSQSALWGAIFINVSSQPFDFWRTNRRRKMAQFTFDNNLMLFMHGRNPLRHDGKIPSSHYPFWKNRYLRHNWNWWGCVGWPHLSSIGVRMMTWSVYPTTFYVTFQIWKKPKTVCSGSATIWGSRRRATIGRFKNEAVAAARQERD